MKQRVFMWCFMICQLERFSTVKSSRMNTYESNDRFSDDRVLWWLIGLWYTQYLNLKTFLAFPAITINPSHEQLTGEPPATMRMQSSTPARSLSLLKQQFTRTAEVKFQRPYSSLTAAPPGYLCFSKMECSIMQKT